MICPSCKRDDLPADANVCPYCGAAVVPSKGQDPTAPVPGVQIDVQQSIGGIGAVAAGSAGGDTSVKGIEIGTVTGDVTAQTTQVLTHIAGDQTGQIITGSHNVVHNVIVGSPHGVGIFSLPAEAFPEPESRPTPLRILPLAVTFIVGRQDEIGRALKSVSNSLPVEFNGQPGLGKSTLLSYVAHHVPEDAFADGIVYLSRRGVPMDDLLDGLFDTFYKCPQPYKPESREALLSYLRDKQALIVLDDVELSRDDLRDFRGSLPGSTLMFACQQRLLWGDGDSLALSGLPAEDAIALVEHEIDRKLTDEERPLAQQLVAELGGNPWKLMQFAAGLKDGQPFADSGAAADAEAVINGLDEAETKVLEALAAVAPAAVHREHLAAVTKIRLLDPVLRRLLQRNLIEAASPSYRLLGPLAAVIEEQADLAAWRVRMVDYFAGWSVAHRGDLDLMAENSEALIRTMDHGAVLGRWPEVLQIAQATEDSAVLTGRWATWEHLGQTALAAARALADPAAEARALHQLGSRELLRGNRQTGEEMLRRAMGIREELGDEWGARLSRHNLGLTSGPPPKVPRLPFWPFGRVRNGHYGIVAPILVVLVLMLLSLLLFRLLGGCSLPFCTAAPNGDEQIDATASVTMTSPVWLSPSITTPSSTPLPTSIPPPSSTMPVPSNTATPTRIMTPSISPTSTTTATPRSDTATPNGATDTPPSATPPPTRATDTPRSDTPTPSAT